MTTIPSTSEHTSARLRHIPKYILVVTWGLGVGRKLSVLLGIGLARARYRRDAQRQVESRAAPRRLPVLPREGERVYCWGRESLSKSCPTTRPAHVATVFPACVLIVLVRPGFESAGMIPTLVVNPKAGRGMIRTAFATAVEVRPAASSAQVFPLTSNY